MQQYKQRRMSATVKGMEDAADQLEHRIVEQEDAIHTMENRNYFSLYCLQMETQLIHANMETLIVMFKNMADLQIKKHSEVSCFDFQPVLRTAHESFFHIANV